MQFFLNLGISSVFLDHRNNEEVIPFPYYFVHLFHTLDFDTWLLIVELILQIYLIREIFNYFAWTPWVINIFEFRSYIWNDDAIFCVKSWSWSCDTILKSLSIRLCELQNTNGRNVTLSKVNRYRKKYSNNHHCIYTLFMYRNFDNVWMLKRSQFLIFKKVSGGDYSFNNQRNNG